MYFSRSWILISALALCAPAAAAPTREPASAPRPDGPPMRVTIVRGAYPGCEPNCEEWIAAEGRIGKQSPALFRAAIDAAEPRKPPILIHSGGGDVDSAIAIGRLLRQKGFQVAVARTEFLAEAAPTAAEPARGKIKKPEPPRARGFARSLQASCASACTLILAAGTRRYVGPTALVGLHEIVVPETTVTQTMRYYRIRTLTKGGRVVSKEKVFVGEKNFVRHIGRSKPTPETYRRVRRYLAEMGETKEVVDLMMTAPPESMRWLTRAELVSTKLATDERGGETLVAYVPPPPPPPKFAVRPIYETFVALQRETAASSHAPPSSPPSPPSIRPPSWLELDRDWALPAGLSGGLLLLLILSSLFRTLRGPEPQRWRPPVAGDAP